MRILAALGVMAAIALSPASASASAADWIRETLNRAAQDTAVCGAENAAVRGTLSRFGSKELPESGKVIVVNIPSGVVTAYENGVPVIESKAVVGGTSTRTPEMDTHVTFVRPNPTWTVPRSIIKRKGWLKKLQTEPEFFDENGFDVSVAGRIVDPREAAQDVAGVTAFVQRPGPGNALGFLKIGIANDQAIYLHDTNDPGKFESEVRAASSGCVRIEKVRELGAWVLGVPLGDMDAMIDSGDVSNHEPPEPVRVIIGYWTAWPDDSGTLRFYPDIYDLDSKGAQCGPSSAPAEEGETRYYDDAPANRPRFEPDGSRRLPSPQWTEYQVR